MGSTTVDNKVPPFGTARKWDDIDHCTGSPYYYRALVPQSTRDLWAKDKLHSNMKEVISMVPEDVKGEGSVQPARLVEFFNVLYCMYLCHVSICMQTYMYGQLCIQRLHK